MARKTLKAYLPRWILAVLIPILLVVWGVITYVTLGAPHGRQEGSVASWIAVTLVILLVGAMLWLMGSGRLPAYIIEIEEDDDPLDG